MEEVELLQEQLDLHLETLKKVDESIRHLNVTDIDLNGDNNDLSKSKRIVVMNSNGTDRTRRDRSANESSTTTSDAKVLKRKYSEETPRKVKNSDANQSGSDDDAHTSRKVVKSSVVASNMPIKRREDLIKIQNKFNGAEQRNKRIVGVILGTLRQFKNEDTERSATTQAINRKELEKKIEIKKIEEKKKILEEKKKLEEERLLAVSKIKMLEQKISLTKEFNQWKLNQLQYKKFIRTKTRPFIFYLPKELDSKSTSLLEETAVQIDEQIAKKFKMTEDEINRLKQEELEESNSTNKEEENKENNKKLENISNSTNNSTTNNKNTDDKEDSSSESEMDEEKNTIVRIGDEVEEDEEQANKTNEIIKNSQQMEEETSKEDTKEDSESTNMETSADPQ